MNRPILLFGGVAIWQDKCYNDIQACNVRFVLLVFMIASVYYRVFSYIQGLSLGQDIAM